MHLVSLENVSLAFGLEPLLDKVKLQINAGERVCLIGRNGAGKSSLLKVIEGVQLPDTGKVWRSPQLRLARLEQELPVENNKTVYEFVSEGLAETGELLAIYHALTQRLAETHTEKDLSQLEAIQREIDAKDGWHFDRDIQAILTHLALNADQKVSELSGGWQRRAALAQALVGKPTLLLLDEPTNHLDIEAIAWLEDELLTSGCALLFITHDRALLKRLATRIIELDRGNLTSWPGNYEHFLCHKEELLQAEVKAHADFDKKLAQEEVWIRQGIKARRTRNEGRVSALKAMREERTRRRQVQAKASFGLDAGEMSGQLVIEAKHISKQFNQTVLIKDFSLRMMRGDKIGLIGPNGIGKSTLLNILLKNIEPDSGEVVHGTKLQIAYFDQLRRALNLEQNLRENVIEGSDFIEINGKKQHIMSYLSHFLFTPERALTPVKALSGGECNRLLLAKLFSQAANLLVMDEPTNDLDIETLELLEELLNEYPGTLLLVSHDREFIDHVVTSTLVFTGDGDIQEYVGGYREIESLQKNKVKKEVKIKSLVKEKVPAEKQSNKLSYKEQRELDELPKKIEKLELERTRLQAALSDPEFYKKERTLISETKQQLQEIELAIEKAYIRWEELM